jgi:hypothetical protein
MHRKEQYCYHNAKSFGNRNLMFWNDTSYISNSMVVTTTLAPFYVFLSHGQILWRCTSPIPKSIMNVKAFLPRLIGYYKNFIKNYCNITESLFELTKKDVNFHWNPHCQVAFDKLKQHLLEALVLTILYFTNTFILNVNWLVKGVGPILFHNNGKHEHVIAYASYKGLILV